MKMHKRANQILEFLTEEKKMEVSQLAQKLGVSQVTVRKDLDELESQGIIVREHGFACLRSTDNLLGRIAYHYEAKQKIARRAAKLIADGDTLMIESGSCCALLAEELTVSKKDLTIITNSAFIADYIRGKCSYTKLVAARRQPPQYRKPIDRGFLFGHYRKAMRQYTVVHARRGVIRRNAVRPHDPESIFFPEHVRRPDDIYRLGRIVSVHGTVFRTVRDHGVV